MNQVMQAITFICRFSIKYVVRNPVFKEQAINTVLGLSTTEM